MSDSPMSDDPKHGSDTSGPSDPASLFAEFLARREENSSRDDSADFEAFVAAHPEHEAALRELKRMDDALEAGMKAAMPGGDGLSFFRHPRGGLLGRLGASTGTDAGLGAKIREPGDRIGDFRLVQLLGSGGMGEVWEAEEVSLRRRVALKLVRPERVNEKTLTLFAREARAGGKLAHPSIIGVHGYGETDGVHWINQELVEGGWTLRDFIEEMRRKESLPEDYYRRVAGLLVQLAKAFQAAHDAGVIHRDIKPQNILIAPDDTPKVGDFGLARIEGETALTMTGDFAGTYLYMSPEQVAARRMGLDHRSDIFSLGIVAYELLGLQRPFEGDTTHQIAEKTLLWDPPELHKQRSRIPADLSVITGKMLEKRPQDRYQSMGEVAADIERHLGDEPILAQPPGAVMRAVKWCKRHPTRSLVTTVGVLGLLAVTGLTLHISAQESVLAAQRDRLASDNADLVAKKQRLEKARDRAQSSADAAQEAAQAAQGRAREAQQNADDAWRLSLQQNDLNLLAKADELWPPHPEKIPAFEAWVTEAQDLLTELPQLVRKRNELRSLALPRSEEEIQRERETHPDFPRLATLGAEVEAKRLALGVREGTVELELPEDEASGYPGDASALIGIAREMVKPERDTFGQEPLGLALARRATRLASGDERAGILDTLAWAAFAVGRDEEALAASRSALEAASADQRDAFNGYLEKLKAAVDAARSEAGLAGARKEVAELEAERAALEARVNERREWTFPAELEAETRPGWWLEVVTDLIARLDSLTAEDTGLLSEAGVDPDHGWSVPRRLQAAHRLQAGFAPGGAFRARWEAALPAIRAAYPNLDLPIQMGLVPIGPDPASGLWEFWHVLSGDEPRRDAEGRLQLEESSGIVFVLLRGGTFWMGASPDPKAPHNFDPEAQENESPVHEVELSAFFLSKYEMTQGQWLRLAGQNPSADDPETQLLDYQHDLTHPVETVTWGECTGLLGHFGLTLPSEAQWEYGARGGTETPWWTGRERESLRTQHAANLADQSAAKAGEAWPDIQDWPELEDGYAFHAPVDSYAPNPFGLYNVHGNVWEWCLDADESEPYGPSKGKDPVNESATSATRVTRGGGFYNAASLARSAYRGLCSPRNLSNDLGLRPAQGITSSPFLPSPPLTPRSAPPGTSGR